MAPALHTTDTRSVPTYPAGPQSGKTIRRQPSASRITVPTRAKAGTAPSSSQLQEQQDAAAAAAVAGVGTPLELQLPLDNSLLARPRKPRTKKVIARRRARSEGTESEDSDEDETQDEDATSSVDSAASSSSVSQASVSDSDDSEEDSGADDDIDSEDGSRNDAAHDIAAAEQLADPTASGSDAGLEAAHQSPDANGHAHQQWSKMVSEDEDEGSGSEGQPRQAAIASGPADQDPGLRSAAAASRGGRGARAGRGRGRGGFAQQAVAASHVGAALAYREKLEKDPSFTPRVGQFWGHDERLLDQDLRGLSGWWRGRGGGTPPTGRGRGRGRGRGGAAFVGGVGGVGGGGGSAAGGNESLAVVRANGAAVRGRGSYVPRGGFAVHGHSAVSSASGNLQGGAVRSMAGSATATPTRKSKLAGWDDDESEVDDDALHGKSVRRVPAAARPIVQQQPQQHQSIHQQQQIRRPMPNFEVAGAPKAPRAHREAQKHAEAAPKQDLAQDGAAIGRNRQAAGAGVGVGEKTHNEWQEGELVGDHKVGAWKAKLDEAQVSPTLGPNKPDSAIDVSSSTNGTGGSMSPIAAAEGEDTDAARNPSAEHRGSLPAQDESKALRAGVTSLPSSGFGRSPGAGNGQWTHDGFEALQQADTASGNTAGRGGARGRGVGIGGGNGIRGAAVPRGFVRGRGSFAGFRGRGAFAPVFVRGRGGAASTARGSARGAHAAGVPGSRLGSTSQLPASEATSAASTSQSALFDTAKGLASDTSVAAPTDSERLTALVKGLALADRPSADGAAVGAPTPNGSVKVNLPRIRSDDESPPLGSDGRGGSLYMDAVPGRALDGHGVEVDSGPASGQSGNLSHDPVHSQSLPNGGLQQQRQQGQKAGIRRGHSRASTSLTSAAATRPSFQPRSTQPDASGPHAADAGPPPSTSVLAGAARAREFRPESAASGHAASHTDIYAAEPPNPDYLPEAPHAYPAADGYGYTPSLGAGGAVYYHGFGYAPAAGYLIDASLQPMYSPSYGPPPFAWVQSDSHPVTPLQGPGSDGQGRPFEGYIGHYALPSLGPAGPYFQPVVLQASGSGDQIATPVYEYPATPHYGGYAVPTGEAFPGYYTHPPGAESVQAHSGYHPSAHAYSQQAIPEPHPHQPDGGSYPMPNTGSGDFR